MLLHFAGDAARDWRKRIRVYQKPGIFYSEWAYVESVDGSSDHISVSFNPRTRQPVPVRLTVTRTVDSLVMLDWSGRPLDLGKRWRWEVARDNRVHD